MSTTTIASLINALQEIADTYGEDTQVLCAHQPNYPLAEVLSAVVVAKYIGGEMVKPAQGYCDSCRAAGNYNDAVMYDDESEMAYCAECAEENGFGSPEGDEGSVAWLLLGGHPSEYGNALHTSPYAPRSLWDRDFGDAEYTLD